MRGFSLHVGNDMILLQAFYKYLKRYPYDLPDSDKEEEIDKVIGDFIEEIFSKLIEWADSK